MALGATIKRRGLIPRHYLFLEGLLRDLSVFVDESGTQGGRTAYYVVTFVLHDQSDAIASRVTAYELSLTNHGLPNIPFHATPLMRAHDDYQALEVSQRKQMLVSFATMVQRLPIRYRSFVYRSKEFGDSRRLQSLIRRDLVNLLIDHLGYFQSFDRVKIYYDQAQRAVTQALRDAFEYALAREAVIQRESDYRTFRLAQVADYLCAIELAACKYERGEQTETDLRFFGSRGSFRRNWLKQARRKLLR